MGGRGRRIVITGSPLSGKTDLAKRLSQRLDLPLIKMGDIVREIAQNWPDLQKALDEGNTIDSDRLDDAVFDKMRERNNSGWICEGFPRFVPQLLKLTGEGGADVMVWAETTLSLAISRAKTRERSDDTIENIKRRFAWFHSQTRPILYYVTGLKLMNLANFANMFQFDTPEQYEEALSSLVVAVESSLPSKIIKPAH